METAKKVAKSTLAIIILSLIGKVMGLGREKLIAYRFGVGMEKDAYVAAQAATAIFSQFITTSIATTFIPGLQKVENQLGPDHKLKYTNNMLFLVSLISLVLSVLGMIFAPYVSLLTGFGFDKETFALLTELTRIGMPVIIFSSIVGVLTGYLQHEGRFAAAGAVAIPLNTVGIIYLVFFTGNFGIKGMTIASVLGIFAQILFLLPDSFRAGYRFKFIADFRDKYAKEALILALPVLVSVSVSNINVIVNRSLASGLESGSVSVLDYANKLNTLVLGIFITAITAIIFPSLTKAFGRDDYIQGKRVMNAGVKTVLLITVPSTIGLIVLARPLVELVYQSGRFSAENTIATTEVLRFYSLALISMSLNMVLNRVFYSIQDTKTPFIIGVINVGINVLLNLLVVNILGVRGLALSLSLATTIAAIMSFYYLRKKIGRLGIRSYVKALIKTALAGIVMGIFCIAFFYPIEGLLVGMLSGRMLVLGKLVLILLTIGIAAGIYGVILYFLGFREVRDLVTIIKNRRMRKIGATS